MGAGWKGSNLPICVFPKVTKFDTALTLFFFVITVFNIGATVAVIPVVIIIIERLYTLSPTSAVIGCRLDDVGSICCRCVRFKCF